MRVGIKVFFALFIVVCLAAAIVLVQAPEMLSGSSSNKKVVIGAIFPLTSRAVQLGKDWQQGVLIGQQLSSGTQPKINVFFEDDKCDAKESLSAYQKLSLQGIRLFIGPGCSAGVLAIGPVAQTEQNLIFTPGAGADTVIQIGDFVFRNNASSSKKSIALANFAATHYKKVAVLYDGSTDALVIEEKAFVSQAKTLGINITSENAYQGSDFDFKTALSKLLENKPDAVFIASIMPNASVIFKQLRELDSNIQVLTNESTAADSEFINVAGALADGTIFSSTDFGWANDPFFWDTYNKEYQISPSIYAAQAYDNFMILKKIISKRCFTGDPVCIKNELIKIQNYSGASGVISFDMNRDAIKRLVIKIIKNGSAIDLNG